MIFFGGRGWEASSRCYVMLKSEGRTRKSIMRFRHLTIFVLCRLLQGQAPTRLIGEHDSVPVTSRMYFFSAGGVSLKYHVCALLHALKICAQPSKLSQSLAEPHSAPSSLSEQRDCHCSVFYYRLLPCTSGP